MLRIALFVVVISAWLASNSAAQTIVWEQSDFGTTSSANASDFLPAGDFTLAAPTKIGGFTVWLSDAPDISGGDEIANGVFTSFSGTLSWYFFADNGGLPGALITSGTATSITVTDTGVDRTGTFIDDIFRVTGTVSPPVTLNPGTYWFGFREGLPGQAHDDTEILWLFHNGVQGAFTKLFLDGQTPGDLNEAPNADNAFILYAVPEPGGIMLIVAGCIGLLSCSRRLSRRTGRTHPEASLAV